MKPYYDADGITIYHADCRELIDSRSVSADVLILDPPYGYNYSSNHGASWRGRAIVGDSSSETRDRVLSSWPLIKPAAIFGSWKVKPPPDIRVALVWDKGSAFGMGDLELPWKSSWELIWIRGRGWMGYRDEGVLRGHIVVSWESKGGSHPNQKPITLIEVLLRKAPLGIVLDPCCGSGSTLVAAKNLNRKAIGIEIEERYCEIAAERLSQCVLQLGAS